MAAMERERSGSGIPPVTPPPVKLPEQPQPAPPKKPKLSAQSILIIGVAGVLLAVLATCFIVFALGAAQTPAQAVAKAAGEGFNVQRELVQVSLAQVSATPDPPAADPSGSEEAAGPVTSKLGERSVYFFVSNEQLACALLERKASGYKVRDVSGHLPLTGEGKPGIWMLSGFSGTNEYLVFGLLYDTTKTKVEVDGNPAVIVDTGRYRCWYYLGTGATAINSESVVFK